MDFITIRTDSFQMVLLTALQDADKAFTEEIEEVNSSVAVEDTIVISLKTPATIRATTVVQNESVEADAVEELIKVPSVEVKIMATVEDLVKIVNHIQIQCKKLTRA